jgi:phage terminase large subunit|nr:MAG TPA: large terminase [Caudoviricetes sp.]
MEFKTVTIIDQLPENVEIKSFGLSFGYHFDESAILGCCLVENNLYLKEILYTKDYQSIINKLITENKVVIADGVDPKLISDFREMGINIQTFKKYKGLGSVVTSMWENYNIYITKDSKNLINDLNPIGISPFIDALFYWCSAGIKLNNFI